MTEIVIVCNSCQNYNTHQRDEKDFEIRPTEFNFSSAVDHKKNNPDHWMDIVIREETEE